VGSVFRRDQAIVVWINNQSERCSRYASSAAESSVTFDDCLCDVTHMRVDQVPHLFVVLDYKKFHSVRVGLWINAAQYEAEVARRE
jgi:hypothetical protein